MVFNTKPKKKIEVVSKEIAVNRFRIGGYFGIYLHFFSSHICLPKLGIHLKAAKTDNGFQMPVVKVIFAVE